MENLTSILIGVTTSFIASIIFFFSSNFIKEKGNQLIDWFASKNKSYSNKLFTNIAQGKSTFAEVFPAFALLFIIFNSLAVLSFKLADRNEIQLQLIEEFRKNPKIDYEMLYQLDETFKKKQAFENHSFVRNNFWVYIAIKYFLYGFTFISTIYVALSILRWSRINDYNKQFRRSLEIITPYVEKEKVDILKSKWGLMTSSDEYDEIYNEVIAHVKKIEDERKKPTPNNA